MGDSSLESQVELTETRFDCKQIHSNIHQVLSYTSNKLNTKPT